jgi:hypothetical protein
VNGAVPAVLRFPSGENTASRGALRKALLGNLRISGSPVIVDLSGCRTLTHEDVDLLLECMAGVAGRDTLLLFVAGSRANRVLLEVTRISSLVPVFNSMEEALAYPEVAPANDAGNHVKSQSEGIWRAA